MLPKNEDLLSYATFIDEMHTSLTQRVGQIEKMVVEKNSKALSELLQADRETISILYAHLERLKQSITNINHMRQYVDMCDY